jgi:hypothetical protein
MYDTQIAHLGVNPVTGRTLLHYTIVEKLGEGGMGVGFHCEIRFEHAPTAIEAVRWIWELHDNAKQLGNESGLRDCILLRHSSRSALPNHMHLFDSWQGPPSR